MQISTIQPRKIPQAQHPIRAWHTCKKVREYKEESQLTEDCKKQYICQIKTLKQSQWQSGIPKTKQKKKTFEMDIAIDVEVQTLEQLGDNESSWASTGNKFNAIH